MYSRPTVGHHSMLKRTSNYDLFAGWQYLLSAKYRRATHQRWRDENRALVTGEILGGLFGIAMTSWFGWFAVMAIYSI